MSIHILSQRKIYLQLSDEKWHFLRFFREKRVYATLSVRHTMCVYCRTLVKMYLVTTHLMPKKSFITRLHITRDRYFQCISAVSMRSSLLCYRFSKASRVGNLSMLWILKSYTFPRITHFLVTAQRSFTIFGSAKSDIFSNFIALLQTCEWALSDFIPPNIVNNTLEAGVLNLPHKILFFMRASMPHEKVEFCRRWVEWVEWHC